jgi:hypothetical protein
MNHYIFWLKHNWLIMLDIVKTIMLGVLLLLAIFLLGQLGDQAHKIKSLTQQNNGLSKQLNHSNKDIKTHIDCIITFFGLPNRQQLSIANICHFQTTPAGAVIQPAPSTPASATSKTTPSPNPNTNPPTIQNENPTNQTIPEALSPEPLRVVGIPVCIVLTHICLDR